MKQVSRVSTQLVNKNPLTLYLNLIVEKIDKKLILEAEK